MAEPNASVDLPAAVKELETPGVVVLMTTPPAVTLDEGDALTTASTTSTTIPMTDPDLDPSLENPGGGMFAQEEVQIVGPDREEELEAPKKDGNVNVVDDAGHDDDDDDDEASSSSSFPLRIRRTVSDGDEPPPIPSAHESTESGAATAAAAAVVLAPDPADGNGDGDGGDDDDGERGATAAVPPNADVILAAAENVTTATTTTTTIATASTDDGVHDGEDTPEFPPQEGSATVGNVDHLGPKEEEEEEEVEADSLAELKEDGDDVVLPTGAATSSNLVEIDPVTPLDRATTTVAAPNEEKDSVDAQPDESEEVGADAVVSPEESARFGEEEEMERPAEPDEPATLTTSTTLDGTAGVTDRTALDTAAAGEDAVESEGAGDAAPRGREGTASNGDDDGDGPSLDEGAVPEASGFTSTVRETEESAPAGAAAAAAAAAESTIRAAPPDPDLLTPRPVLEPADLDLLETADRDPLSVPAGAADLMRGDASKDPTSEPVRGKGTDDEAERSWQPSPPPTAEDEASTVPVEGEADPPTGDVGGGGAPALDGALVTAVGATAENVKADADDLEPAVHDDDKATRKRPYEEEPPESSGSNSTHDENLEAGRAEMGNPDARIDTFKAKKSKKERKQKKEKKRKKEKKKKKDKKRESKGSSMTLSSGDDYDDTSCYDSTSCDDSEAHDSDAPLVPREVRSSTQGSAVLLPPPTFDDSAEFDDKPLLEAVATIGSPARTEGPQSETVLQEGNEATIIELPVETSSTHVADETSEAPVQVAESAYAHSDDGATESLPIESVADIPTEETSQSLDTDGAQDPMPVEIDAVQMDGFDRGSDASVAPAGDDSGDTEPDVVDVQVTERNADDSYIQSTGAQLFRDESHQPGETTDALVSNVELLDEPDSASSEVQQSASDHATGEDVVVNVAAAYDNDDETHNGVERSPVDSVGPDMTDSGAPVPEMHTAPNPEGAPTPAGEVAAPESEDIEPLPSDAICPSPDILSRVDVATSCEVKQVSLDHVKPATGSVDMVPSAGEAKQDDESSHVGESRQPTGIYQSALNDDHSVLQMAWAPCTNVEIAEKSDSDRVEHSPSLQLEPDIGAAEEPEPDVETTQGSDGRSTKSEERLSLDRIVAQSTPLNAVALNIEPVVEGSEGDAGSSVLQLVSDERTADAPESNTEHSVEPEGNKEVDRENEGLDLVGLKGAEGEDAYAEAEADAARVEATTENSNQQAQHPAYDLQDVSERAHVAVVEMATDPASKISPRSDKVADVGEGAYSDVSEAPKGIEKDSGVAANVLIADRELLEMVDHRQAEVTSSKKPSMLVLVSNQALKREVAANQQMAFTVLSALKIPYETLDGSLPANQIQRNELFALSGLRGQYPQFFKLSHAQAKEPVTTFYGDWDQFQWANECGSLRSEFATVEGAGESLDNGTATIQGHSMQLESREECLPQPDTASDDQVASLEELPAERGINKSQREEPPLVAQASSNVTTSVCSEPQIGDDSQPVIVRQEGVNGEPIKAGRRSPIPPKRAVAVPAVFGGKASTEPDDAEIQRPGRGSPIAPKRAVVVPSAFSGRAMQADEQDRPVGMSSPTLKTKALVVPTAFCGLGTGETVERFEEEPIRLGRTSPIPPKKAVVVPAAFGGSFGNSMEQTGEVAMPRAGRSSPIPPKKAVVVPAAFGGPNARGAPSDLGPQRFGRSSPIVAKKAVVVPAAFKGTVGQSAVPRGSPVTVTKSALIQTAASSTGRIEAQEGSLPRQSPSAGSRRVLVPASVGGESRSPTGPPSNSPSMEKMAVATLPFGGRPKHLLSSASPEPSKSSASFPEANVAEARDVPTTTQLSRRRVSIPSAFSSPESKPSVSGASLPYPASSIRSESNSDSLHTRANEVDIVDMQSKLAHPSASGGSKALDHTEIASAPSRASDLTRTHVRTDSKTKLSIPPAFGGGPKAIDNPARRVGEQSLKSSSDHVGLSFSSPTKKLAIPAAFGASPASRSNQPLLSRSMHSTPSVSSPGPVTSKGRGPPVPSPSSEASDERQMRGEPWSSFDLAPTLTKKKVQVPAAFGSPSSHGPTRALAVTPPNPRTRPGDGPITGTIESSSTGSAPPSSVPMAGVELFPSRSKVAIPDAFGRASSHGLTSSSHHGASRASSRSTVGLSSSSHHKGTTSFVPPSVAPASTTNGTASTNQGARKSIPSSSSSASKYVTVGDAVMTRAAAAAFAAQEDALMSEDTGDIPMVRRSRPSGQVSGSPVPKKKVAIPAAFLGGAR